MCIMLRTQSGQEQLDRISPLLRFKRDLTDFPCVACNMSFDSIFDGGEEFYLFGEEEFESIVIHSNRRGEEERSWTNSTNDR